jgi:putative ATPase
VNSLLAVVRLSNSSSLEIVQGDITIETTDGIVNAANAFLQHGAGVAGAIVRRGGEAIQRESTEWVRTHGPVSHDAPAWTSGGNLSARVVLHAVGPVWGEGQENAKLAQAVAGCLRLASELGLQSLALPALSTGVFGFPPEQAGVCILETILAYFRDNHSPLQLLRLVVYDPQTSSAFLKVWHDHFDPQP